MSKYFVIAILLITSTVRAQTQPVASGTPNSPVPDAPAFRILNTNPEKISRPSAPREVAAGLGNFLQGGGILPSAFFAEFSPYALLGSLSLQAYQDDAFDRFLYRTRLSVATMARDSGTNSWRSSIGIRFTLYADDNADPRTNTFLVNFIRAEHAKALNDVHPHIPSDTEKFWGAADPSQAGIDAAITQSIRNFKEKSWNASLSELGFALRYLNADSLVRDVRIDAAALWLASAWRFGDKGQLVISSSPTMLRGSTGMMDSTTADLSSRFYSGSNELKFFLEGSLQGSWYKDTSGMAHSAGSLVGLLGGEYNVWANVWLDFSAGFTKDLTTSDGYRLTTSFKVKFGNGK